jgi:hypothetical protein
VGQRFNGRMSDLVKQTRFTSAADLDATLTEYLTTCNPHIPECALNHQSPIKALKCLANRQAGIVRKTRL